MFPILYIRAIQIAARDQIWLFEQIFLALMGLENCIEFSSSDGKYGLNTEHNFILALCCTYTNTVENHTNVIHVN